jgi:hypothetical protein
VILIHDYENDLSAAEAEHNDLLAMMTAMETVERSGIDEVINFWTNQ